MNLIVDVGNSAVKIAVFQANKLVGKSMVSEDKFLEEIQNVKENFPEITHAILSTVTNSEAEIAKYLQENFSFLTLEAGTPQPFINRYATPETLGQDRIALAAAASVEFPNQNVLIIDAGTCLTVDFVNAHNEYFGGSISPGVQMRYNALHKFTAKLPLLKPDENSELTGSTTNKSMHSGVMNGIACEIDGVVSAYRSEHGYLTVILTGGDTQILLKRLKNSIFADSNFLLKGLNYILEFNKTQ